MKESLKRYNNAVVSTHNSNLFSEVISEQNVQSYRMMPKFKTKDIPEQTITREGYFVIKERQKYFINAEAFKEMPIKMISHEEVIDKNDNLVYLINDYKSFNIRPENVFDKENNYFKDRYEFFEDFYGVNHSEALQFKAFKVLMFACEIGKVSLCISTEKGFGKTQIAKLLSNMCNDSSVSPVGSKKGMLDKFSGNGCLWLDEAKDMTPDQKKAREELILHLAGSSDSIKNGSLKTSQTKSEYNIKQQSMCLLYNLVEYYSKNSDFFDYAVDNKDAVFDRIFQFRFTGMSTEVFDDRFDFDKTAEENKMFYINCAKYIKYLKKLIRTDDYKERFKYGWSSELTSRKTSQLMDIKWVADFFSRNQEEFTEVMSCIEKANNDYQKALE